MNGYELVKRIKVIRPETKVVFMTAIRRTRKGNWKNNRSLWLSSSHEKPRNQIQPWEVHKYSKK
jgi:hypothetical protein